ncbi:unnamed protein product [Durusdinium trenchii]|uniref:Methyltransferase FkbM domain-containing protein n=1 Tax=Durusdinium trenchii TaxID=1381693 RepID=A0ABP0HCR0_9DINO
MGVQTLKHRREAAGRRVIPAGHSKRTLAVLRRHGVMRPSDRQLRQCELCQKQRRIGRWWWPPRQLVQAGAASSDAGIAGSAALQAAPPGVKGYWKYCLWCCRPCWDNWLVQYKQWFHDDNWSPAKLNSGVSEESLSSSSSRGEKRKSSQSVPKTGEVFHYDFIEIGTSNYHTFTQAAGSHPSYKPCAYRYLPKGDLSQLRGLAVDMKRRYLQQLPDLPNVTKVKAAISDREIVLPMHHVKLADIEHWERIFATQGNYRGFRLIRLARGCSALGRHKVLSHALGLLGLRHLIRVRSMKTKTVEWLFRQHQVGTVGVLALDCEGHDCAIVKGLIDACKQRREWYPKWILFETNGMNDEYFGKGTERSTVDALLAEGYELFWGGGYHDSILAAQKWI